MERYTVKNMVVKREKARWSLTELNDILKDYPSLNKYAAPVKAPVRNVLGRDVELQSLLASLSRVEVSNPILLGNAGSGKTMIVQQASIVDKNRIYLEVNVAKMAASENGEDGALQMATRIKNLFDEAEQFRKNSISDESTPELVLFIDEFHQIINLSSAATEAIKPALADSATRGIKIIAATTFDEFDQYISSNQALVERLQRINVRELGKDIVVETLKDMAREYNVANLIVDRSIYSDIYDYSNRYIPANSQPRKSILILDAMIGWYKMYKTKIDRQLLAKVIYENSGVNVSFNVDGREIENSLNARVISQEYAVKMIGRHLQIAIADLQDKSRPMASFLFTGPTGVGKTEMAKAMANLIFGSERELIRFDMSEYSRPESVDKFREELTSRVWRKPYSIVLIDEIEKADPSTSRLLLQVLDDAKLNDKNNREVSFANSYIIMTTNVGSEVYKNIAQYAQDDNGSGGMFDYVKVIQASLRNSQSFPTELINRIDVPISFQPLSPKTQERILNIKLNRFKDLVKEKHGVTLVIKKNVRDYLIYENLDNDTDNGGARGVVRRMNLELVSSTARYINTHPLEKNIAAVIAGDLAYLDKTKRVSRAQIVVGSINSNK